MREAEKNCLDDDHDMASTDRQNRDKMINQLIYKSDRVSINLTNNTLQSKTSNPKQIRYNSRTQSGMNRMTYLIIVY
jgi:hypothetical protein